MIFPAIVISIYIAIFITSPIIVVLHELGHAFAYLLLTKPQRIDIYIGTYDNSKYTFQFRAAKFHFYVKLSFPLIKGIGFCHSSKAEPHPFKLSIILLAGVLFTVLIAAIAAFFAFSSDVHGAVKLYCFALLIFSCTSLFQNLFGKDIFSNQHLESDGAQLKFIMKLWKHYKEYAQAIELINTKQYTKAAVILETILNTIKPDAKTAKQLMGLFYLCKEYQLCIKCFEILKKMGRAVVADYVIAGAAYSLLDEHELAINANLKVLHADERNIYALVNSAYSYIETGNFVKAEAHLQNALDLNKEFAHTYINLGYLYTKLKRYDEAKPMLEKGVSLNDQDPFFYKYLGEFYLELGDAENAILNFNKCTELDPDFDIANELNQAREGLKTSPAL